MFYHHDVLGSPVTATNELGQVLWHERTESYGKSEGRVSQNGNAFGDNALPAANSRQGYTGHTLDNSAGLTYMKARYYDHNIGRFLSNDPVGFSTSRSGTFNRYSYVENNPYRSVDPTGESLVEVFTELAPAAGRAFGGLAAWGVGHATGNGALVDAAVAGMAAQQGDNLFAAASVFGPPGASKVRKAGITNGSVPNSASTLHTRGLKPAAGTRVRPEGVPDNWKVRQTDSGGGVEFYNPKNRNESVRIMQGNSNSPYTNSQAPYARQRDSSGTFYRQDGSLSSEPKGGLRDEAAHIPLDQFEVR